MWSLTRAHTDGNPCYTLAKRAIREDSELPMWTKTDDGLCGGFLSGDVILLPGMQAAMLDGKEMRESDTQHEGGFPFH